MRYSTTSSFFLCYSPDDDGLFWTWMAPILLNWPKGQPPLFVEVSSKLTLLQVVFWLMTQKEFCV